MTRPGTRLRAFAARVCSAATMERLIDPVIADLQAEHGEAVRAGRVWRSRWALMVGYVAFAKVFVLAGLFAPAWRNWTPDDRQGLKRMAWYTVAVTISVSVLVGLPGVLRVPDIVTFREINIGLLMLYLLPSTLALSVPAGLAIGTTLGISGHPRSRRLVIAILLIALAGSAASFANIAWLTPASNQLFREEVMGRPVEKGENELTLTELRSWELFSNPRSFLFHARLALTAAPLTFVVFGLVIATRRLTRTAAVISASAGLVCYTSGLISGAMFTATGVLPGPLAAWLPQLALIGTTILVSVFVSSNRVPITRTPA